MSHKLTEKLTLGATLAYAPDVWQSGAWGTYAAGALSLDLPSELLPADVGWALSADLGRSVFGPTSSAGGVSAGGAGLPLPAYNNWRAGLTFSYNVFKLGLNYTDTTLSKEHCYRDDRRSRGHPRRREHGRQSDRIALTSCAARHSRQRSVSKSILRCADDSARRARRAIQACRFPLHAGSLAHFRRSSEFACTGKYPSRVASRRRNFEHPVPVITFRVGRKHLHRLCCFSHRLFRFSICSDLPCLPSARQPCSAADIITLWSYSS